MHLCIFLSTTMIQLCRGHSNEVINQSHKTIISSHGLTAILSIQSYHQIKHKKVPVNEPTIKGLTLSEP